MNFIAPSARLFLVVVIGPSFFLVRIIVTFLSFVTEIIGGHLGYEASSGHTNLLNKNKVQGIDTYCQLIPGTLAIIIQIVVWTEPISFHRVPIYLSSIRRHHVSIP